MTNRQEDKVTMWTTVDAVLENYEAVWTALGGFKQAAEKFRGIREEVDPEAGRQKSSNKGYTVAKHVSSNDLVSSSWQMAKNIETYAMDTQDLVLEKQYCYTMSDLNKLRDNELPILVKSIIVKAKELGDKLVNYGVTKEGLAELNKSLEEYNVKNPAPTLAKGQRKQATVNVAKKITEGTEQLKRMDNLIGNFSKKNPEFVAAFLNARNVINITGHKKGKDKPSDETGKAE